jgi:DNA-binding SARP family transcriptional activator
MSLVSETARPGPDDNGVEFRILGPLEINTRSGLVPIGPLKQRALLAYLLVYPNQVIPAGRLVEALWGADPPRTARQSLQNGIGGLRKLMRVTDGVGTTTIVTRAPGYMLEVDPRVIDVHEFLRLRGEARAALAGQRFDEASRLLGRALSRWRGSALSDLAEAGINWPVIDYLGGMRLAALEDRIDADLQLGNYSDSAGELAQLVTVAPLRERFWELLILALYWADRQADALSAYRDCRRVIIDELGIEPNERLRDLERAILTRDTPYLRGLLDRPPSAAPPAPDPLQTGVLNLPVPSP